MRARGLIGFCLLTLLGCGVANAQTPGALAIPAVPTTRILAIGTLSPSATPDALHGIMPDEVRATLDLYLGGKIVDWYSRKDTRGVVFVIAVTDIEQARALLEALPLGKAHLMTFELIPLGPLAPLGLLKGPTK